MVTIYQLVFVKSLKHELKMTNNKTTKGICRFRNYLKVVFVFADYHEHLSYGLGFSRYLFAYPTSNQDAKTIAKALINTMTKHAGLPTTFISDKGTDFISHVIKEVAGVQDVRKNAMQAYIKYKVYKDKKANASKLKEADYVYVLEPKADHQGSKIPFTEFRGIGPYVIEKLLPNKNYLVRKIGTKKTQALHRM